MPTTNSRLLVCLFVVTLSAPAAAQSLADRVPVLKPVWKVTAVGPRVEDYTPGLEEIAKREEQAIAWVLKLYDAATADRKAANRPLIPPFLPLGYENLVIYHNNHSVVARSLQNLEAFGNSLRPGEVSWACGREFSLVVMARDDGHRTTLDRWVSGLGKEMASEVVWGRTLPHALAVGNGRVYHIDELAFPRARRTPDEFPQSYGPFVDAVRANRLRRIDIESGKLSIKIGEAPWDRVAKLPDYHFLSVPLSAAGGTTFIWELDRSLRVTRLDLNRFHKAINGKWSDPRAHLEAVAKEADWNTELMTVPESVTTDVHRRIHALHLTAADGLIICPTHLGHVAALDQKTGKIVWFHEYAPVTAKRFPTFAPEWVVVPPAVADGKYVYAPADFPELLCLNLADGQKVWSVKKGDGLYPAVVGDKVLVVGEKTLRALHLKDGTEAWKLDLPGLPCGRGAVLGSDYLLPISEPKTWKGTIAVVDVKAGRVREVLKPEKEEPVGNLVVHQDFLLSQTLTEMAVYPLKKRE